MSLSWSVSSLDFRRILPAFASAAAASVAVAAASAISAFICSSRVLIRAQ